MIPSLKSDDIARGDSFGGRQKLRQVSVHASNSEQADTELRPLSPSIRRTCRVAPQGLEYRASLRAKRKQDVHKRLVRCCRRIIENTAVVTLTTLLTLWVLICDDVRVIATEKPQDIAFEVVLIVSLVVFGVEIILTSIGKEDYFMGFFFILDVISTASLALDLPSLQDDMATDEGGVRSTSEGKTARIGAKAARVVRIVRLLRIVKLYKILVTHFEQRFDTWMGIKPGEDTTLFEGDLHDEPQKRESRVGKQLSHATLKRVIILILAMLIVVPSLSASESLKYPISPSYGADEVGETFTAMESNLVPQLFFERAILRYIYYHNWFAGNGECPTGKSGSCPNSYYNHLFWVGVSGADHNAVQSLVGASTIRPDTIKTWEASVAHRSDLYNFGSMPATAQTALGSKWQIDCSRTRSDGVREFMYGISLLDHLGDQVKFAVRCPSDLRATEYDRYYPRLTDKATAQQGHFVFFFDQRKYLQEQAAFGMAVTVYVCFSLVMSIMFFSHDANRLVLNPVESMIAKVEAIRENPLAAVRMGDQEFRQEEQERIKQRRTMARYGAGKLGYLRSMLWKAEYPNSRNRSKQPMETMILEKTLVKLGSLLALGFGEAGANIINKNMQAGDSADVDVMVPGELVQCIYGQARIQDFSIITEVLQSKVMTFVNQIAEIVHGVVVEFGGAANKNTGDTFLLVWRSTQEDGSDLPKLADMSVCAFCKILASLQMASSLAAYRGHPRIQYLLGSDYRVDVNVGLHAGWAFEGAMGSEYKIDASYISPNIAITSQVEQAAQHFRVHILITDHVIKKCSPVVAAVCRKIDTVYIAGHPTVMHLHCIDVDINTLSVVPSGPPLTWNPRQRYKVRQFMESERNRNWNDDTIATRAMHKEVSMRLMRHRFSVQFMQIFAMGFKNYVEGEWQVAQVLLVRACQVLGSPDGPSESLLAFMQQTKFIAPADWKGHRFLAPLLQGRPSRISTGTAKQVTVNSKQKDMFDLVAMPSEGGSPAEGASWQLPNSVPQEDAGGLPAEVTVSFPPAKELRFTARGNDGEHEEFV